VFSTPDHKTDLSLTPSDSWFGAWLGLTGANLPCVSWSQALWYVQFYISVSHDFCNLSTFFFRFSSHIVSSLPFEGQATRNIQSDHLPAYIAATTYSCLFSLKLLQIYHSHERTWTNASENRRWLLCVTAQVL